MSNEIIQIPREKTVLDGTEWFEGQDDTGGPGSSFKAQLASLLDLGIARVDHDADYTLTSETLYALHTNIGATIATIASLPPALIGRGGVFLKYEDFDVTLEPNGTDKFQGAAAGEYLRFISGGTIVIDCLVDGTWTITTKGDCLVTFQNGRILDPPGRKSVIEWGIFPNGADVSTKLNAAIASGFDLEFPSGEYPANNLVQSHDYQSFFGLGDVRIIKNANGVLFASSGDGVICRDIKFYGDDASPAVLTGDTVTFSGDNCAMINCGSRWAYGRALKATGGHFQIVGTNDIYQTTDATGSGYDIEIGVAGTATLYHELIGVTSSQHTGGILLVDTGSAVINGGQFGKLNIRSDVAVAGVNGGATMGCRIGGVVTIEQSSALFTANLFGSAAHITIQTGASGTGVSGVSIDESNGFGTGQTITNNGNMSNHIRRQQGDGGTYTISNILYGADAGPGAYGIRDVIGTGDPEGHVTAAGGSTYIDLNWGTSQGRYVKATGNGNTGWENTRGRYATAVVNPANQVAGTSTIIATLTVTGAVVGDRVSASFDQDLQGMILHGYVSAADTVKVVLANLTGGDINLAQDDLRVRVFSA